MEKPIFELLTEISKIEYFDNEDKSGRFNSEQRASVSEKERQLTYLLQQGFISKTREIYIITEYGYHVAQFKRWSDYLIHQKSLLDRKTKKEKYDLYISWFQSKTGWLPYLLSAIGIGISLYALSKANDDNNPDQYKTDHKEKANRLSKYKDSLTKNTQNLKVVNKDTFYLSSQKTDE